MKVEEEEETIESRVKVLNEGKKKIVCLFFFCAIKFIITLYGKVFNIAYG